MPSFWGSVANYCVVPAFMPGTATARDLSHCMQGSRHPLSRCRLRGNDEEPYNSFVTKD